MCGGCGENEYSRVQSFNAGETRFLVLGLEATWYLYEARSLQPLGLFPFSGSVDPRWLADDPNLLYYSEETRLMSYHIQSGEQAVVYEVAADFPGQPLSATLDTRGWTAEAREIDSVTISSLGNYFFVYMDKYCQPGQLGTEQNPCGLMVYDRSLQNGRACCASPATPTPPSTRRGARCWFIRMPRPPGAHPLSGGRKHRTRLLG